MEALKDFVSQINDRKNIFIPVYIICEQHSFQNYLKELIAKESQISANVKFISTEDLFKAITGVVLGNKEDYRWGIFKALDGLETGFDELKNYINQDTSKRYALAKVLADLFINYETETQVEIKEDWQQKLFEDLFLLDEQVRLKDFSTINPIEGQVAKFPDVYFMEFETLNPLKKSMLDYFADKGLDVKRVDCTPATFEASEFVQKFDKYGFVDCHSPAREVEVLHDHLVKLFAAKTDAEEFFAASDVLIKVTDPESYFPLIRGVFDSTRVRIPYSINGFEPSQSQSFQVLEHYINIDADLKAEDILGLAELSLVQEYYQFNNLSKIRELCKKANVVYGYENKLDNETYFVGWKHFFDRVLLGFAIGEDIRYDLDGHSAGLMYDVVEGQDLEDVLRLKAFVDRLYASKRKKFSSNISIQEHLDGLLEDLESVVGENGVYPINSLNHHLKDVRDLEVDGRLFKQIVLDYIESSRTSYSSSKKGVQFESIHTLNFKPRKVIGFLGLNASEFPQKDKVYSFDALREVPNYSRYQSQKSNFYKQLSCASDYVYFSYQGRSIKNNKERLKSSVLSELFPKEDAVKHALHSFSSIYNKEDENLFSYHLSRDVKTTDQKSEKDNSETTEIKSNQIVDIDNLLSFWKEPIKWFYNKKLGIYLSDEEIELEQYELIEPDNLQKWRVKSDLMELDFENEEVVEYYRQGAIESRLIPLKSLSKLQLNKLESEVFDLKSTVTEAVAGRKPKKVSIEKELKVSLGEERSVNVSLQGMIDEVYDQELISYSVSSLSKLKYRVQFYLKYLLLSVSGEINAARFFMLNSNPWSLPSLKKEEAESELRFFLELFLKSSSQIQRIDLGFMENKKKSLLDPDPENDFGRMLDGYIMNDRSFPSEYLKNENSLGNGLDMDLCKSVLEVFNSKNILA